MAYPVVGIDVSHWRPVVDFSKIPDAITFFGAKATQGETACDPTLSSHRDGSRKKGFVLTIYYHYAGGGNPKIEASNFLNTLGPLQSNERLALDVEGNNPVSLPWIVEFLSCLPTDRKHLVYVSNNTWNALGNPPYPDATVGNVDLWTARYGPKEPVCPPPWSYWTFWQFTEGYYVPGINGLSDASYYFGSLDQLKAYAQLKPAV